MNLHDIKSDTTAAIWAWIVNGRGGHITDFVHSYIVDRGTPPPLGDRDRANWTPYRDLWQDRLIKAPLAPRCGPVKTRSRMPEGHIAWEDNWRDPRCPDCRALAPETQWHQPMLQLDPYMALRAQINYIGIGWDEYVQRLANIVDPVTGR